MKVIGYQGAEADELYCLCCVSEGLSVDTGNPLTKEAYPDGFTCSECWGSVDSDGYVMHRVG